VTYFSYFFKGGVSYETQLSISEMNVSQRMGDMVTTLCETFILYVTFGVEALAAILIYN
jgi:trk system potassium uptake protein TrkH